MEPLLVAVRGKPYHVGVARQVLAGGLCFRRALGVVRWPSVRRCGDIALGNEGDSGCGRPESSRTRRCSECRPQCGHYGDGVERGMSSMVWLAEVRPGAAEGLGMDVGLSSGKPRFSRGRAGN